MEDFSDERLIGAYDALRRLDTSPVIRGQARAVVSDLAVTYREELERRGYTFAEAQ